MGQRITFTGNGDGETDKGTHFYLGYGGDYTLCGLSLDGDPNTTGSFETTTTRKVDCQYCIQIVEFGKSIKKSEYKK